MDPLSIRMVAEVVGPVLVTLILSGAVLGGMFLSKHFKLRAKELELEAQFHAREAEARLRALETRQAAAEAALNAVAGLLQQHQLLQPPQTRIDPALASQPPLAEPAAPGEATVRALGAPGRNTR